MKTLISLLAACAAGLALPAFAQESATKPAEQEAAKPAKAEEDKKICKRVSSGMGSRRTERVCLTAEEWRKANHQ